METHYPGYLALLEELRGSLDQLTGLAKEKNAAVLKDDLLALDEVLKQEQALSLSLRGLEQRRLKLVRELGLDNVPLSRLCDHCPDESKGQAKQTAERLRASYDIYQSAAGVAKGTLERGLHELEKIVVGLGGPAAPPPPPSPLRAAPKDPGVEPPPNMKTDFRA